MNYEFIKKVISYFATNAVVFNGLGEKKDTHYVGVAYFTVAQIIYDEIFDGRDIMPGQELIWHMLFQTLFDSLTTENYTKILLDNISVVSSLAIATSI